jgi:hypothetical protein
VDLRLAIRRRSRHLMANDRLSVIWPHLPLQVRGRVQSPVAVDVAIDLDQLLACRGHEPQQWYRTR